MSIYTVFEKLRVEGQAVMMETESEAILNEAGLPVIDCWEVHSAAKVVQLSESIGFTVVFKILSPKVTHKSDGEDGHV